MKVYTYKDIQKELQVSYQSARKILNNIISRDCGRNIYKKVIIAKKVYLVIKEGDLWSALTETN